MTEYNIRNMAVNEFRTIYRRIREDFPQDEYAPYEVLQRQMQAGIQEGLILQADGRDVAYAVCAGGHKNGYVLVSLLAVFKEWRRQGCGSAFIKKIQAKYQDKNGLIVEVEKPEKAMTSAERQIRLKRMSFYEKAGFYQIPGIDYHLWNVPLHLMVFPQKAPAAVIDSRIGEIMFDIYLQLLNENHIHEFKFNYTEKNS